MPISRPHPLTLAAIGWALFIVYGTTLPFDFSSTTDGLGPVWERTLYELKRGPSLPDVVSNVLLFIPWGLFVAARLALRGRGVSISTLAGLLSGALLSASVEWLQLYLPSRSTSPVDLVTNSSGALLGGLAGWVIARRLYPRLAPGLLRLMGTRPFACLGGATLAVLAILALEPFDLSIDVGSLKSAVKSARLIPWGATVDGTLPGPRPWSDMETLLSWVLVGGMLGLAAREAGRVGARALALSVGTSAVVATGMELAQLAVGGRTTDATTALMATLGAAVGAGLILLSPKREPRAWLTPALVLWCGTLMFYRWTPPSPTLPTQLPTSMFVPFFYYYARTDVMALADLFRETASSLPLGALLAARGERWTVAGGVAVGLALGVTLEVGQLFNLARTADITDALSAALGAGAGVWVWRRVVALQKTVIDLP